MVSLSRSEIELKRRKNEIENLLFYKPDLITREILNDFYGSANELLNCINERLLVTVEKYLESRLNHKKNSFVKRSGKLTGRSIRYLTNDQNFLPKPFLIRIKKRLRYIRIDMCTVQEDFIKLQTIKQLLKEKGYIIQNEPNPYY